MSSTQSNAHALHRLAAFTRDPYGGNPAGVWIGDALPDAATMQRIAAEVGYSETAFVAPTPGSESDAFARTVRYYSPEAEVSFCGHATIATGVALGETSGDGTYRLATRVGEVPVVVEAHGEGAGEHRVASLTSVEPEQKAVIEEQVDAALATLGWHRDELDPAIPPVVAYAGAWHLVLAVADEHRLAALDYDFEALKALMLHEDWTTLQLVWRAEPALFHARNPFPVGGVVEDPATGAAAAALGGYLRAAGLLDTSSVEGTSRFVIRQGEAMGRPSRLTVDVPASGGIVVSGAAVRLPEPEASAGDESTEDSRT